MGSYFGHQSAAQLLLDVATSAAERIQQTAGSKCITSAQASSPVLSPQVALKATAWIQPQPPSLNNVVPLQQKYRSAPLAFSSVNGTRDSGSDASAQADEVGQLSSTCSSISTASLSSLQNSEKATQLQPRQAKKFKYYGLLWWLRPIAGWLRLRVPMLSAYMPIGRQHSLAKPDSAADMAGALDAILANLHSSVIGASRMQESIPLGEVLSSIHPLPVTCMYWYLQGCSRISCAFL